MLEVALLAFGGILVAWTFAPETPRVQAKAVAAKPVARAAPA